MSNNSVVGKGIEGLYTQISKLIESFRGRVAAAVNLAEVYTKFCIGKYIVEDELKGKYRAEYGKQVLGQLSVRLIEKYGDGWSVETLKRCRKFYKIYSVNSVDQIQDGLNPHVAFTLSWSHYLVLMRIENENERRFYEIECRNQNWSVRWLQRQISSSLYERIAISRDKDEILNLSNKGQTITKPEDIIKNPITLEFLGIKPDMSYTESSLETSIIDKMQQFLLEMGKGFLFETRQKRFTFDEENFFVDLVFYNRLLQCYVLVDIKVDKLTHQDLGQMQMYVNYYDRFVKQDFEKPTIGILLCKEKKDALIRLTLPEDANIYASAYALYLPDKKELQRKLRLWIEEYERMRKDTLKLK